MTLAVRAKYILRGPSVFLRVLEAAFAGKMIPVKGKHAKTKPVPISPMKTECLDPAGEAVEGLQFNSREVTRAKKPAKT